MNATHTPGPWHLNPSQSPASIGAPSQHGAALAKVYLTNPQTKKREAEYLANAQLMTAAPDLLEALECIICHETITNPHRLEAARQAIARARGEHP